MDIRSMGAEFFHADRRVNGKPDMTKLVVAFGNSAKAFIKGTRSFIVYRAL